MLINICNFAPGNSKLLSMSSIRRPYLRGKQTQILRGQQRGNGSAKMISMAMQFIIINLKKISNQFIFNARIKTVDGLMKAL